LNINIVRWLSSKTDQTQPGNWSCFVFREKAG